MAQDLRGLYSNNRRREVNAATSAIPYVLEDADLREGTAQVVATSDDYTTLTIPANSLVTRVTLVVETHGVYGAGSTAAVTIGGNVAIVATSIAAAGASTFATPILIEGGDADVVITLVVAGVSTENSVAKVVVEYTDYDRATMSYIGEQ